MIKFKYRYCKVQMVRYVSGDLSDAARRRVARYIEECEDCYREFRRQRDFAPAAGEQLAEFRPPRRGTIGSTVGIGRARSTGAKQWPRVV